jgi:hypothetical protein
MSATTEEYKGHFIAGKVPAYRLGPNGQAVVEVNGIDKELGRYGSSESRHRYLRILAKFQTNGVNQEIVPRAIANYRRLKARKEKQRAERQVQLRLQKERQERERLELLERKANRERRREQLQKENEEKRKVTKARLQCFAIPVDDWIVDATLLKLGRVLRDMVRLQRLIGCEAAEICGITPNGVRTSSDKQIELKRTDCGKTRIRVMELSNEAYEILKPYLNRRGEEYCFSPLEAVANMLEGQHKNSTNLMLKDSVPGARAKEKTKRVFGDKYKRERYVHRVKCAAKKAFPVPDGLTKEAIDEWIQKYHWHPDQLARNDGIQNERRESGK